MMKVNMLFPVLWLCPALLSAATLDSRLEEVRLYPSGGELVRLIELGTPIEETMLTVDRLPGSIQQQGLRAEVITGGGVRLGGLRFRHLALHELPASPELMKKEAALTSLDQKLADLADSINLEAERAELFADLQEALLKGIEENPDPEASDRVWEAFAGQRQALAAKRDREREVADEIEQLKDEKTALQEEIRQLRRSHEALNGRLELELLEAGEGPVVIRLTAPVNRVGWSPAYRINALPAEGEWDFSYQANLHNETGERWDAVPVSLLTGRPGWQLSAPELPPVYLAKEERMTRQKAYSLAMAMEVDSRAAMDAAPEAAYEPEAERLTTQFSLKLPQPVSMDGFERARTVDLAHASLEASFWSETAPSLSETAFLHSETLLDLEWPILPGPATLLVDGAVSGNSRLPSAQIGEELELGFGENPSILVDFKVLGLEDRDSGVFDKVRRYARTYQTEITNLMPVAHTVKVKSRFPLSRDAEIEVKRIAPESVEVDEETGRFFWEASLAPQQSRLFDTRFEVVAPRDWALSGSF